MIENSKKDQLIDELIYVLAEYDYDNWQSYSSEEIVEMFAEGFKYEGYTDMTTEELIKYVREMFGDCEDDPTIELANQIEAIIAIEKELNKEG